MDLHNRDILKIADRTCMFILELFHDDHDVDGHDDNNDDDDGDDDDDENND